MREMRALSLFSGVGGIDLAAEAAGIRTVAMCEKDPFCRSVLRKHWPDVPIFEDVKKLRGEDIGAAIDVIHGGPPCQPVSVAGRRRGQDDERYLWGEVFRLVADIMPRFCVFENVPGILSIAGDEICQSLERLGYSVGVWMYEAAAVGAPHRRMRVFIVGHAERGGLSGEPWRRAGAIPSDRREDVPDADGEWELQQGRSLGELGGWSCHSSGRSPQPGMGRDIDGLSPWLDEDWERGIPRVARGVKDRVNRLRALGNAVVPAQIYPVFRAIAEIEVARDELRS
jgi:DNA (cytosine-5)-methyltransferase 1